MSIDVSRLVLDAASFPKAKSGTQPSDRAVRLLRRAHLSGVRAFHTNTAESETEQHIAAAFEKGAAPATFTRIDVLSRLSPKAREADAEEAAAEAVNGSLMRQKRAQIDTAVVADPAHLVSHNGAIWRHLTRLQRAGAIQRLGVCVSTPEEALAALAVKGVQHLQIPFNLLDWRWRDAHIADAFAARPDVSVHARDVFLKTLMLNEDPVEWPQIRGVDGEGTLYMLDTLTRLYGRHSLADLALAYVRGQDFISGVVMTLKYEDELDQVLALFDAPAMTPDEISSLEPRLPHFPPALFDPAGWGAA